jgi:anti-sigma B factor antagonist
MKFRIETVEKNHIIYMTGALTNEYIEDAMIHIKNAITSESLTVILDMSEVAFICSSALGMLFTCLNDAKRNKKKLCIAGLRDDIQKLFVITGVDRHLPLYENSKEALKASS